LYSFQKKKKYHIQVLGLYLTDIRAIHKYGEMAVEKMAFLQLLHRVKTITDNIIQSQRIDNT
jgi:hypothetical protein